MGASRGPDESVGGVPRKFRRKLERQRRHRGGDLEVQEALLVPERARLASFSSSARARIMLILLSADVQVGVALLGDVDGQAELRNHTRLWWLIHTSAEGGHHPDLVGQPVLG